ncbi:nuclear-pore anchor-like [Magnolia sinica]|uniref:nuclear-pore anchor-like n=1 Tax=Magnolia sinica TaxID=86752 RepID=UPI00265B2562|nr:nuclear-pore anchor-like [Magnolia sinica]
MQKAKEEMEKLKGEAQANKDHMLWVVWICYLDLLSDTLKAEADKLKKSLEDEIHFLKGRVLELESDLVSKSTEVTSTVSGKEEVPSSYDRLSKQGSLHRFRSEGTKIFH